MVGYIVHVLYTVAQLGRISANMLCSNDESYMFYAFYSVYYSNWKHASIHWSYELFDYSFCQCGGWLCLPVLCVVSDVHLLVVLVKCVCVCSYMAMKM